MKTASKWTTVLILIGVSIISCEQEPSVKPSDQLGTLTDKIISSRTFLNLDIPVNSLYVTGSLFINAEKRSVLIPFKGWDDRKGIIALFNDDQEILTVVSYEAVTDTPSDLIYDELKSGSFSGTMIFRDEAGDLEINMQNSRIVSSKSIDRNITGRTLACAGMTEQGGPLWCAGARLENMNWFDAALCYASFMACMAELVISCAIDGCDLASVEPA